MTNDLQTVACFRDRRASDPDARMTCEESAAWFRLSPVDRKRIAGFGIATANQVQDCGSTAITDEEYDAFSDGDHRTRVADIYRDVPRAGGLADHRRSGWSLC